MILYLIRPTHLVITTPNVAYNPLIPNMKTRFRHPDHKIEYTREEWEMEVLKPLVAAGYVLREHKLLPEEEAEGGDKERIQPSFLVTAQLDESRRGDPAAAKLASRIGAELSSM